MKPVLGMFLGALLGFGLWIVMVLITSGNVGRGGSLNLWDLFLLVVFVIVGGQVGRDGMSRGKRRD